MWGPAEPSARFHNWRYRCGSLAGRAGMGKQRLKMGVRHSTLMSWQTGVALMCTHFPWSEYLLWHTCAEIWSLSKSVKAVEVVRDFCEAFSSQSHINWESLIFTIMKQTLAKFKIPNAKVQNFHTTRCTCAAVGQHSETKEGIWLPCNWKQRACCYCSRENSTVSQAGQELHFELPELTRA